MSEEAILDCQNCKSRWVCCRHSLRVELDDGEVDQYQHEAALRERKGIKILAQVNGRCVYFDPRSKRCAIWDRRPKVCRSYDCAKDPRVADIMSRDLLPPLDEGGNCRVVVSVAVLEEKDKRKVSPMMVYSRSGPTSADTFEVRGRGKALVENVKRMLEIQLRPLLGDQGEDR
jgi:hypothetical protein